MVALIMIFVVTIFRTVISRLFPADFMGPAMETWDIWSNIAFIIWSGSAWVMEIQFQFSLQQID